MKESNSNDPIVSVIIPIYNVKRHIVKGLQVLNKQHFRDFEIILIDDGSTDGSSEICDAASDKNAQIKVLHKTNGGAGSARNMGIDYACGKYIYFFDIDDELKPSLLEYCVAKMEELKLDMLWFGFETIDVTHSNKCDTISFKEHLIQSNKELKECYIDELLLIPNGNGFPWNKFYRKDFLDRHHLRFENQRIQQDEVFNLLVYPHVERAYISPEVLYTYYIYEKGNTRSRFIPDRFDIYVSVREHFEKIKSYWQLNDSRMEDYLQKRFWSSLTSGIVPNMFHPDCSWNTQQKEKELKRYSVHPMTKSCLQYVSHTQGLENRLYYYSFQHANLYVLKWSYNLFSFLRNIKHKLK